MTTGLLRCARCHFALRPTVTVVASDFCPRCLARRGVQAPLRALDEAPVATPTGSTPTESAQLKPGDQAAATEGMRKHATAVTRTLSWAQEAADRGDFCDALDWLRTVEAVDGEIPTSWHRARESWHFMAAQQRVG